MNQLSIKTQFYIGAAIILLFCCVGASWYQFQNMHDQALTSVNNKTEIFLSTAASIRAYVKDTLRPKVTETLSSDQFILEAMSTSYISRQIMSHLKKNYPEFNYKRAALNPRNPVNSADPFERRMLNWFGEHPDNKQWSGRIRKEGRSYYVRMMAIRAEKSCLSCHGIPADAPRELKNMYGTGSGYGFEPGSIVGADTIYIPMDETNLLIKEKTAWVFLYGCLSLFSLFALFVLLFNRTVVQHLKRLLHAFRGIYSDRPDDFDALLNHPGDEITQIKYAFENVAANLKMVHDELKESEAKYRTLFQASPDTIFVTDEKGSITDLNRAGVSLFEVEYLDRFLEESHFNDLFADPEEGSELLRLIEEYRSVVNTERRMVTQQGTQLIGMISANCLINEDNEFVGVEGVIRDVTEEKKLSKHLAATERLASVGQLAAGVAHEINNPLGVILCYSDLIKKNKMIDEQIGEDAETIRKHAHSCKTIVESLLNFARVSDTRMKKADINACLYEILSVLQNQMKKQDIKVLKHLNDEIGEVVFDEDKIKQVFMNLLLNSMQAMPNGGELSLRTALIPENEEIVINIADTGYGIPEDKLDKIFEPFFTTKERGQGTGLGLSVSYGIIEQHQGGITVSSQPGTGTTFSITLPVNGSPNRLPTPAN